MQDLALRPFAPKSWARLRDRLRVSFGPLPLRVGVRLRDRMMVRVRISFGCLPLKVGGSAQGRDGRSGQGLSIGSFRLRRQGDNASARTALQCQRVSMSRG